MVAMATNNNLPSDEQLRAAERHQMGHGKRGPCRKCLDRGTPQPRYAGTDGYSGDCMCPEEGCLDRTAEDRCAAYIPGGGGVCHWLS